LKSTLIQNGSISLAGVPSEASGVRQKIISFLQQQTEPKTPVETAKGAELNENTVRKELQAMLKAGIVIKNDKHAYRLLNPGDPPPVVLPPPSNEKPQKETLVQGEKTMPKVFDKLPKIRVDEILFYAYTAPAEMTKSASIDERETVVYRVLPRDLAQRLEELKREFDREASRHLKTLMSRKLFFIRYPIDKHKAALQVLVENWNIKYGDFVKALSEKQGELETAVAAFYEKHHLSRDMPDLSPTVLHERFRISQQLIPFSLRTDIISDVFTSDEMQRIKDQAKQQVMEKYREDMNTATSEFFASVKKAMQRLNKGKMITKATLAKMHRLYDEALEGLAITQDERYTGTFEIMENMVETLANRRQQHKVIKNDKETASSIIAETLEVTRAIGTKAKPTLEQFEAILTADKQPVKKKREGIREVIEGLTIPTVTEEQKTTSS